MSSHSQHEAEARSSYTPPGTARSAAPVEWVRNTDGTLLLDHNNKPISVPRLLATKPLRHELSSRPGPGNRKLTYLSGEGVTRTLNDIFGYDGWNLDIKDTRREVRNNATTTITLVFHPFQCHTVLLLLFTSTGYIRNVRKTIRVVSMSPTQLQLG
jgi:hypothetical protein